MNCFQIYGRKWLSVFILVIQKLVLPLDDLLRCDTAHSQLSEIRKQLGLYDVIFGCPCVFLYASLYIFSIMLHEALEGHIQISAEAIDLLSFPSLCLTLGLKATLLRLLTLTVPAGVAVQYTPSVCLFVFINCHFITSLS